VPIAIWKLLETKYQRASADQAHPGGIVRFLDDMGLLSPRFTLAHCTWARPEELALIAERSATIAVNTSSNLGLKSGIAPLAEMLKQGCKVAMGLDGMVFHEDDDALREARLADALHRGWGYDTTMTPAQLWRFASRGRTMVDAGRVCGVDELALQAELRGRLRAALASDDAHQGWRGTVQALAQDLAPFYRNGRLGGCCG
jgi:hypothetical protein